jgi:hypothetical protein
LASATHCRIAQRELGVGPDEAAAWRGAARTMFVLYDEALGVHPQAEQFTQHAVWDFARTGPDKYPLMLHFHYFDLYRKQVVKQANLVLALYLRGDAFSPEAKARNFEYYESLTVRDSSLSAFVQAVVAAEVGHLELAYDYFGEAALLDLGNLHHNTREGVHLASPARRLDRRGGRVWQHARPRRLAQLRSPAPTATLPSGLPTLLPRAPHPGRGGPTASSVHPAPGRPARRRPPQCHPNPHAGRTGDALDPGAAGPRGPCPVAGRRCGAGRRSGRGYRTGVEEAGSKSRPPPCGYVFPAKCCFSQVGDAGVEPATSAV